MVRASLIACVLLMLGTIAIPSPAAAYEARGYVPYDGWFRGAPSYHGFVWRDPLVAGTDARRPDFTQWSNFDRSELRLKYPLYRDPVHPVHRVATPACTGHVHPVRTDILLTAAGIPEISERCPHRRTCRHHCRRDRCAKKRSCAPKACCATKCGPDLSPPAAAEGGAAAVAVEAPEGD